MLLETYQRPKPSRSHSARVGTVVLVSAVPPGPRVLQLLSVVSSPTESGVAPSCTRAPG